MKILITSCFGIVGRGIINSIKQSVYKDSYIIGTDILNRRYGLKSYYVNKFIKVPKFSDEEYIDTVLNIVQKENPDVVLINNELEVLTLAQTELKNTLLPNSSFANIAIEKGKVFDTLEDKDLVPDSQNLKRKDILTNNFLFKDGEKKWIRDIAAGSTGGAGAAICSSKKEVIEWVKKHKELQEVQVSEYLPGANIACSMLYENGSLKSAVCAERKNYFLGNLVPSGVTGVVDYGLIFYNELIVEKCRQMVELIPGSDSLDGVLTIDLKADVKNNLKLTEVNLRYIGLVYPFALTCYNIVEDHLSLVLGEKIRKKDYSKKYEFYRAMDGFPEAYEILN